MNNSEVVNNEIILLKARTYCRLLGGEPVSLANASNCKNQVAVLGQLFCFDSPEDAKKFYFGFGSTRELVPVNEFLKIVRTLEVIQ